ncbi:MAG TPA: Uma2 family endonuclease [Candidatus Methylomirabilis sp.]|jgi:Uma2 family endonuclease
MTTAMVTTSPMVRRYSLEEFWTLPDPSEGGHHELIGGVLYMVPPPSDPHDVAISRLNLRLAGFLANHPGLGDLFVPRAALWIQEGTYLEPDLMYVSKERQRLSEAGRRSSADLVVEAVSRSTEVYDRQTKADTYAALGVLELWPVYLWRHEIEQRILEGGAWRVAAVARPGEVLRSHTLPGFEVHVAEIFEGLPRD